MWTGWKKGNNERYEGEQRKTNNEERLGRELREKQHTMWIANYLADIFNSEKEYEYQ